MGLIERVALTEGSLVEVAVTMTGSGDFQLTELTIPEGVETIGDAAFEYCPTIEVVHLPITLKNFGIDVFHISDSLKKITLPDSCENFTVEGNVLYSKDMETLVAYPTGLKNTTYDLPSTIKKVAPHAFMGP